MMVVPVASSCLSPSFGNPVDAFFCDASNNQVPDPVLGQGDTIQNVCTQARIVHFYLEDIYMIPSLSLPQASWLTTLYQTAMHRHQPPRIASWACAISEVKFPVASSTKIQIEILIPSELSV
jgi:hypothetical protein